MPSENVALVQKLLDVYNERTFDENSDLIDPDILWDVSRVQLPDAASYHGLSELGDFVEAWEEGFESEHVEIQDTVDAGERVVILVHHRGRGKLSGVETSQRFAMIWTLRDGRAVRMEMYPTLEEALESIGLPAQDAGA